MPGFVLHVNAVLQCSHAAKATVAPTQTKVLVMGQPAAVITNPIAVAGCLFQIPFGVGTKPQPCVTVKWGMPAARVKLFGLPLAVAPNPGPGPGVCQSAGQIPQGPPIVGAVQTRVI